MPHRGHLVADRNGRHPDHTLPGAIAIKPGMATVPFMGVWPALVTDEGKEMDETVASGALVIKKPWPGLMRGVYGDPKRFQETYFEQFPGYYTAGDGARRDKDGYYQITGRIDDVINVSGHRMGTAEVESALVAHPKVAEAAVVGYPMNQGAVDLCLCDPENGCGKVGSPEEGVGRPCPDADRSHCHPGETPVGRWSAQDPERQDHAENPEEGCGKRCFQGSAGDISTLADPSVVDDIVKNRV